MSFRVQPNLYGRAGSLYQQYLQSTHHQEALMAESKTSGSSGSGASATQEKKRYGGNEPLDYPKHEPLDTVTYRDPRPLDWPQKADRSVFIGVVHRVDNDPDADDPKGDYVYANQLTDDPKDEGEIELKGAKVEDAQVVAGGGRLTLIINGDAHDLTALGAGVQSDLQKALQLNANS